MGMLPWVLLFRWSSIYGSSPTQGAAHWRSEPEASDRVCSCRNPSLQVRRTLWRHAELPPLNGGKNRDDVMFVLGKQGKLHNPYPHWRFNEPVAEFGTAALDGKNIIGVTASSLLYDHVCKLTIIFRALSLPLLLLFIF